MFTSLGNGTGDILIVATEPKESIRDKQKKLFELVRIVTDAVFSKCAAMPSRLDDTLAKARHDKDLLRDVTKLERPTRSMKKQKEPPLQNVILKVSKGKNKEQLPIAHIVVAPKKACDNSSPTKHQNEKLVQELNDARLQICELKQQIDKGNKNKNRRQSYASTKDSKLQIKVAALVEESKTVQKKLEELARENTILLKTKKELEDAKSLIEKANSKLTTQLEQLKLSRELTDYMEQSPAVLPSTGRATRARSCIEIDILPGNSPPKKRNSKLNKKTLSPTVPEPEISINNLPIQKESLANDDVMSVLHKNLEIMASISTKLSSQPQQNICVGSTGQIIAGTSMPDQSSYCSLQHPTQSLPHSLSFVQPPLPQFNQINALQNPSQFHPTFQTHAQPSYNNLQTYPPLHQAPNHNQYPPSVSYQVPFQPHLQTSQLYQTSTMTQPYQAQTQPQSQPYQAQTQPQSQPYKSQTQPQSQPYQSQTQTQPQSQPHQSQTQPQSQPHQSQSYQLSQPYQAQNQPQLQPYQISTEKQSINQPYQAPQSFQTQCQTQPQSQPYLSSQPYQAQIQPLLQPYQAQGLTEKESNIVQSYQVSQSQTQPQQYQTQPCQSQAPQPSQSSTHQQPQQYQLQTLQSTQFMCPP